MTDLNDNPGCLATILHFLGIKDQSRQSATTIGASQQDRAATATTGLEQQNQPSAATVELLQQNRPASTEVEVFPYKVNRSLLLPSELVFYRALDAVAGKRARICPKVRLGDVFFVADFKENISQYFRIAEKHVDFLLCEPQSMKPIIGIELDDEGHRQRDRKERDEFVKKVFQAAGLPLIHIPAQTKYDTAQLTKRLAPHLGNMPDSPGTTGVPS